MSSLHILIGPPDEFDHALAATQLVLSPHIEATLTVGLFAATEPGVEEQEKLNFSQLIAIVRYEYFRLSGQIDERFSASHFERVFHSTMGNLTNQPAAAEFVARIRQDVELRGYILQGLRGRYERVPNTFRTRLGLPLQANAG